MTTEEKVRKVFCNYCPVAKYRNVRCEYCAVNHAKWMNRSARRFVAMEQREKRKKLMATLKRERKSAVVVGELPENFGKMD